MLAIMSGMMIDIRIQTGRSIPTTYSESAAMGIVAERWRPYVLPVGAVVGGAMGFVAYSGRRYAIADAPTAE